MNAVPQDTDASARWAFDNSYARELEGASVSWQPARARDPRLVFFNAPLAAELGLDCAGLTEDRLAQIFSGNRLPVAAEPIAQAYAGHQFGGFSPQLGDGRALLWGELIDPRGQRRDLAFKGSGRTPFSRGGDGLAALGPMLREVLISEAMHALGIPSTRALAVVSTGEGVFRDTVLPGAVLTRVAASHLRVGTFQYFAARRDETRLRKLIDYAVARHDPGLVGTPDAPLGLLQAVIARQARLIAQWMNVGFIHGVMNTDNMTVSGETIDYGPCAFMEAYQPLAVFSSIDRQGRYAYARQPAMAQWNLARFAETLLPWLAGTADEAVARATEAINGFAQAYTQALWAGQRAKLGLPEESADEAADATLLADWLDLLEVHSVDFTLAWRGLSDWLAGDTAPLYTLFPDRAALELWLARWQARLPIAGTDAQATRVRAMRVASPAIIPRNHRVEEALSAAQEGDFGPFERLLEAIRHPDDDRPGRNADRQPAPPEYTASYRTFCGT